MRGLAPPWRRWGGNLADVSTVAAELEAAGDRWLSSGQHGAGLGAKTLLRWSRMGWERSWLWFVVGRPAAAAAAFPRLLADLGVCLLISRASFSPLPRR